MDDNRGANVHSHTEHIFHQEIIQHLTHATMKQEEEKFAATYQLSTEQTVDDKYHRMQINNRPKP
jgi:hypothetical protein